MSTFKLNLDQITEAFNEVKVNEYKVFYHEHLSRLSDLKRLEALDKLSQLQLKYLKEEPAKRSFVSQELLRLNIEAQNRIKLLLGESVYLLFTKKDFPKQKETVSNNFNKQSLIAPIYIKSLMKITIF